MLADQTVSKCLSLLKERLKAQNITYTKIARSLNVSEVTVKRMLTNPNITMDKLLKISQVAGVDFVELLKRAQQKPSFDYYTDEQDLAFHVNPHLLAYFHLIFIDKLSIAEVRNRFGLSESSEYLYLRKLEELGLRKMSGGAEIQFLVEQPIGFSPSSKVLKASVKQNLLDTYNAVIESPQPGHFLMIRDYKLSPALYGMMADEINKVLGRFAELEDIGSKHAESYRLAVFAHPDSSPAEPPVTPINITEFR